MDDEPERAPTGLTEPATPTRRPEGGPPPLVVTVGFTGHRTLEDPAAARQQIEAALGEIGRAFGLVAGAPLARAFQGAPTLRLLVGAAPGADRIVAEAWRASALGEIHFIYPFREPGGDDAFTDDPAAGDPATRVTPAPEFEPWTGIDAKDIGLVGAQSHAEVGRWVVRHADMLVCWWDGEPGRGAGGANDTIRRALERGLPVVWLGPGDKPSRQINPEQSRLHADAAEVIVDLASIAGPLDAASLAAQLTSVLAPPSGAGPHDPEVAARIDYDAHDPLRRRPAPLGLLRTLANHTLWRAFGLFQKFAGRPGPSPPRAGPPPAVIAAQPGFARLTAASEMAGARADLLSSIHRSEQLLLILIAIVAVFFGALPALVGESPGSNFHAVAAGIEFCLGLLAFTVAWAARRAHRHRRWSDARRLTERLRAVLATWPLGFDIADAHAGPARTWTEWRTRALLRAAGPPRGWITRERFDATARWATAVLLDSQVAYHARQHRMARTIERTMRGLENGAFGVLMATLISYIALSLLQLGPLAHWDAPHWFGGLVTLVSAVAPAVGAGCIALEATNGFGELAMQSARLKDEFEALRARIPSGGTLAYHPFLAVIRRGAEVLVEENDAWRDRLLQRRIVRGG
jgi:hypothetical protein